MISVYNHLKISVEVICLPMLTPVPGEVAGIFVISVPVIWIATQLALWIFMTVKRGWDGFILGLLVTLTFNVPLWYLTH